MHARILLIINFCSEKKNVYEIFPVPYPGTHCNDQSVTVIYMYMLGVIYRI